MPEEREAGTNKSNKLFRWSLLKRVCIAYVWSQLEPRDLFAHHDIVFSWAPHSRTEDNSYTPTKFL